MTDEQSLGGVIDEMYAMISGPAGPRDWGRQANCFTPDARQIRTFVDDAGRPQHTAMNLGGYAGDTTRSSPPMPFTKLRRRGGSTSSATSPMSGARMKRAAPPTTKRPSGAGSTRSSCSATPTTAGASWR